MVNVHLINVGYNNTVAANRVISIVAPDSAPVKRLISDARDRGQLIDATYGRKTRAVVITDSGFILLCGIQPETVANRFVNGKNGHKDNARKDGHQEDS
ncbi:MAG: DUF370 domain-containing protein [Oculatellaceae cyanobacterium Prado106]|jgi:hypothetical protein|nr:DUF370 domain-containing protein [Oculatellaceae cyanobacterium Prado106]